VANPARNGELVGKKLGKYELLALIAVGGTAEIYLARISGASGFEKYLVVKCLLDHLADDQEFVRMFLDEARVSAQLDHSNIVQTLELGEHGGRYFLVMEYLAGMSVAQLARKTQERRIHGGLIDTNLVLGLASQTCSGLQYAHSKMMQGKSLNLVHRDISPQNLVIGFEGILKIVDFGIAKSSIKEVHTRAGTIKGKFAYMSPEQCLAKEVDHRTDIFALGTLCHELLTGRRLFKRKTTYDTYQAIVNGGVPLPSKVNPKLDADIDAVIMKAVEYKVEDRYQSSQEFGEALLSLIHKRGGSAGPGDIARFFDENFSEELTAHSDQMRELITGEKKEAPEATWDSEFDDLAGTPAGAKPSVAKPAEARRAGPTKPPPPPPARKTKPAPVAPNKRPPLAAPARPAAKLGSIPTILPAAPDVNVDADDEDEGPTRIEFNPADRVAAFHEEAKEVDNQWEAPTKHSTPTPSRPMPSNQPSAQQQQMPPVPSMQQQQQMPPVPSMQQQQQHPNTPPPQLRTGGDFSAPPQTINIAQVPGGAAGMLGGMQQQQHSQSPKATLMGQQAAYVNPSLGQQGGPVPTELPHQTSGGHPHMQGSMQPPGIASDGVVYPQISGNFVRQVGGPNKAIATYPNRRQQKGNGASQPLWIHAAVFAAFLGLGFGVAAFIKMML
tara:strand:+ start:41500 stop:43503 length:2004 start_codon:yes stop_codon:yes gene_type:complete